MSEVDEHFKRIKAIFNTAEIPDVSGSTLKHYVKYLKANLRDGSPIL